MRCTHARSAARPHDAEARPEQELLTSPALFEEAAPGFKLKEQAMKKSDLVERAESCLMMVIEDERPSLKSLTMPELRRIWDWAQVMVYEASDNPCRARAAPKALRNLLPAGHYLQTWRMPKRAR